MQKPPVPARLSRIKPKLPAGIGSGLKPGKLALRSGISMLRHGIVRGVLRGNLVPNKAKAMFKAPSVGESLVHGVILRVATRSVPGAILVGGGLLAKALQDRRKARKARQRIAAEAKAGQDGGEEA